MRFLLFLLLALIPACIVGQTNVPANLSPVKKKSGAASFATYKCGSDILLNTKLRNDKGFYDKHKNLDDSLYHKILEKINGKRMGRLQGQIYTVPVVVHITHNNGAENISDAQVIAGIQHLNDAFRKIPPFDGQGSTDIEIQFCLAQQDDYGNFTTGIDRVQSSLTNLDMETEDINLKNLSRWDPESYVNVWLVNEINSLSIGAGVAGYAYFASSHGGPEDGIVCEARWFGSSADNSKIHIHEFGHYFNLYHTFQGGCSNDNCLVNGDKVCDTPPDASIAVSGCSTPPNSCFSDDDDITVINPFRPVADGGSGDQDDMINNYMDYGDQVCQNAFTAGQKERMVAALTDIRGSLLNSRGCLNICTNLISASFNPSTYVIAAGGTVSFTNNTSGATSYVWKINGITHASSTNFNYTFNIAGDYLVELFASNGNPSCSKKFSAAISVYCPVTASFTGPLKIDEGTIGVFNNTSINAGSYQWLLNGLPASVSVNFSNIFNFPGNYSIGLIAKDGICSDTVYATLTVSDTSSCSGGSKRGNVWLFGYGAGIDFNFNPPQPLSNSSMSAYEGCASIADDNGALQFYTDGINVWDNTDTQMPNGWGLLGDPSASQSGIIVPHPGNANLYYIFTVDAIENGGANGFNYSIVDLSLNGGKGDVTVKNVPLQSPTAEKITAVFHNNKNDIWVIGHGLNTDQFWVYLITNSGLNTTPILSNVGSVQDSRGCLKASPDGSLLAAAVTETDLMVEIYKFNNSTGVISNPIKVPIITTAFWGPFGVEFSPDNTKLYLSTWYDAKQLFQFDLTNFNQTDIIASQYLVADASTNFAAMQLGPDGKIYVARENESKIGVINVPNALGPACNFVEEGFDLDNKQCALGMTAIIQSYFTSQGHKIKGALRVCPNSSNIVYQTDDLGNDTFTWSVSGNATITSGQNTNSILISFTTADTVLIVLSGTSDCGNFKDSLAVIIEPSQPDIFLGEDTTICSSIIISPGAGYQNYLWHNGSTGSAFSTDTAGVFWVKVNICGTNHFDSINIYKHPRTLDLGDNFNLCSNGIVRTFHPGPGFSSYKWQDGSTDSIFTTGQFGKYWLTVTNACGDILSDTISINSVNTMELNIIVDSSVSCLNQGIDLKATISNCLPDVIIPHYTEIQIFISCDAEYMTWQIKNSAGIIVASGGPYAFGTTYDAISVPLPPGDYQVFGQDANNNNWCYYSNGIWVEPNYFGLWSDPSGSFTNRIGTFLVTEPGIYEPSPCVDLKYIWSPGQNTGNSIIVKPGTQTEYTVSVEDGLGCIQTASVTLPKYNEAKCELIIPNLVTRNGDGQNDLFFIKGLQPSSKLEIYNSWGDLIFISDNYQNNWSGEDQSDGIYYYHFYSTWNNKSYKGWVEVISNKE
jgi:hypothetical protein